LFIGSYSCAVDAQQSELLVEEVVMNEIAFSHRSINRICSASLSRTAPLLWSMCSYTMANLWRHPTGYVRASLGRSFTSND